MAWRLLRRGGRPAALTVLAAVCLALTAACGGGAGDSPLLSLSGQKGVTACLTAGPQKGTTISRWDTPVGMAFGMYYNQSWAPAKVMSVTLVHPHNLAVRSAVVYKMAQYQHPLPYAGAWADEIAGGEPRPEWAARQQVPGAVIPNEGAPPANFVAAHPDVYEVVAEVQAIAPGDAWTSGYTVTYRVAGTTYSVTTLDGLGIGDGPVASNACDAPEAAIAADWNSS